MASLCNITKEKFFIKIFYEKCCPGNQFQALLNFQRTPRKEESEKVSMMILTNFDSFAITNLK